MESLGLVFRKVTLNETKELQGGFNAGSKYAKMDFLGRGMSKGAENWRTRRSYHYRAGAPWITTNSIRTSRNRIFGVFFKFRFFGAERAQRCPIELKFGGHVGLTIIVPGLHGLPLIRSVRVRTHPCVKFCDFTVRGLSGAQRYPMELKIGGHVGPVCDWPALLISWAVGPKPPPRRRGALTISNHH